MVYGERSPLGEKSEKQELSVQTITLSIDGDICNCYDEPIYQRYLLNALNERLECTSDS